VELSDPSRDFQCQERIVTNQEGQEQKQIPFGNDKQEGQEQKQIPCGNDKPRRARADADSLRE
jgi:hypothetical protein